MPNRSEAPWYETSFGELYPLLYAHRDDTSAASEIAGLLATLAAGPIEGRVLDLCCGAGRHMAILRGRGLRMIGIDLSPQLITLAAERDDLSGRLARGDMRQLPFGPDFDLVVNLFTSFGYFEHEQDNVAALAEMARVLRPGGRLVIDHINRPHIERRLIPRDRRVHGDVTIEQRRQIRAGRVEKNIDLTFADGRTQQLLESVRIYTREEMEALLRSVGFTRIRFCGTFSGDPLSEDSPRMIVLAEKENG